MDVYPIVLRLSSNRLLPTAFGFPSMVFSPHIIGYQGAGANASVYDLMLSLCRRPNVSGDHAANTAAKWSYNHLRKCCGNRSIEGIASRFQNLSAFLRSARMHARNDTSHHSPPDTFDWMGLKLLPSAS